MTEEKPLYPLRITMVCTVGRSCDRTFNENEDGEAVNVAPRNLRNFLWRLFHKTDLDNVFFQQDDATCRWAREILTSLQTASLMATLFKEIVVSSNPSRFFPGRLI